ncbi:putative nuclear RNA export factor SDE5 isoform X1 [Ziziphus jujuba]|uniref:Nuclear RNA export factor SDE5 isoform X1 n=1 Tax=Ziziphus jujuba TaxID=326968 RepID=A0A6P4AKD3_ZIZJJ|nr:putative nuclear RNA export factor SDE5 isoform X1 [Ziziphus jujuba]XP_048328023.1 putative nuclear RNA export factor SDE5 isoform X1 [Ziziphus jujuba]
MEASGLNTSEYSDEEKVLKSLLDAFGSAFSLDEIASAYCKAGRNADSAGEILYEMQGSKATFTTHTFSGESREKESTDSSYGNVAGQSCELNVNSVASKQKHRAASIGIVSSIIDKDYVRGTHSINGSCNATRPLRKNSKVLPVSELCVKEDNSNSARDDCLHRDMEEFLFKMLGDGFKLERGVIREILDTCGYNMQKSMEKLLDISAASLEKGKKFDSKSNNEVLSSSKSEGPEKKHANYSRGNGDRVSNRRVELCTEQKEAIDLPREVLASLFNATERSDESPRGTVKAVKRSGAIGRVAVEPPEYSIVGCMRTPMCSQQHNEYDEEDSYQVLRRAVKEYRGMTKEYYKAAIDALTEGDHIRAGKLLEQGQFFHNKSYEADEKSNEMILETRNMETEDEILLDLHDHGPREAIRLLKCHLSSLSGIPSIEYLKVIIETNEIDTSKGSRRRLIMKLLEKESIKWVEENAGTILIRLDEINPKRLSFVKK